MLTKFEEWGKGYPGLLREAAKFLVAAPYEFEKSESRDFYKSAFNDKRLYPPIRLWLSYYRNQKALFPAIASEALSPQNVDNPLNKELVQGFQDYASRNDMTPDDLFKMLEIDDPESKALIQSYIEPDGIDSSPPGCANESQKPEIRGPEALFLYKVTMVCFLIYGDFPAFIYRKARNGDVTSICKLLLIDKRIIADHRIADSIHLASLDAESEDYKKICKAFSGALDFPSMAKMKAHMAGFIKNYFKGFGIDIKAPEIQELFDAAHEHYNPDEPTDPDLPETPHGFYMALKRKTGIRRPKEKSHKN